MTDTFSIEIANRQSGLLIDEQVFERAITHVLRESEFRSAEISLVIVDDEEMHRLNVEFLNHDYPTDVLSFPLVKKNGFLAGEIIVSADTADRECKSHRLTTTEELMLYVVHGVLHLIGYNDKDEESRIVMRKKEIYFMEKMGVNL